MFIGIGASLPICWMPGYEMANGAFRMWWLCFEIAAFRDDLVTRMLKFHIEQIKGEMGDGTITYYPLDAQHKEG